MKIKSNPSFAFGGLGELVAPFPRSFPNIGAVIGTIANASALSVNIMARRTGTGFDLFSVHSLDGGVVGIQQANAINAEVEEALGTVAKLTATRSGGAWTWDCRYQDEEVGNIFGGDALTVGSVCNRLFSPKTGDSYPGDQVQEVYVLQSLELVATAEDGSAISESFVLIKIGEFVSDAIGFGE